MGFMASYPCVLPKVYDQVTGVKKTFLFPNTHGNTTIWTLVIVAKLWVQPNTLLSLHIGISAQCNVIGTPTLIHLKCKKLSKNPILGNAKKKFVTYERISHLCEHNNFTSSRFVDVSFQMTSNRLFQGFCG